MTPAPTSRNLQLPEPLRARFQTLERRLWLGIVRASAAVVRTSGLTPLK
jgi:hypothetical protein